VIALIALVDVNPTTTWQLPLKQGIVIKSIYMYKNNIITTTWQLPLKQGIVIKSI
jgi:hypothetical protein